MINRLTNKRTDVAITAKEGFPFSIGDFRYTAISGGSLAYAPPIFLPPATFLFPRAQKERLEQVLREYNLRPEHWTEWTSPYICLVISNNKHKVLVETGADGLGPNTGKLCPYAAVLIATTIMIKKIMLKVLMVISSFWNNTIHRIHRILVR